MTTENNLTIKQPNSIVHSSSYQKLPLECVFFLMKVSEGGHNFAKAFTYDNQRTNATTLKHPMYCQLLRGQRVATIHYAGVNQKLNMSVLFGRNLFSSQILVKKDLFCKVVSR